MRKIVASGLILVLGLVFIGCNGSSGNSADSASAGLDKTFSMANGALTFNVSDSWRSDPGVMTDDMEEYVFATSTMSLSVISYPGYDSQPYEHYASIPSLYEQDFGVTNFQDISQKEISLSNIPGATVTIFKFSYSDPDYGDMIENIIHINRNNSSIIIFYSTTSNTYDESILNAFLNSINWTI